MSWNPSVGSGNHCVCLTGCEAQSNVLPKAIFECHCNLYCLALPRAYLTLVTWGSTILVTWGSQFESLKAAVNKNVSQTFLLHKHDWKTALRGRREGKKVCHPAACFTTTYLLLPTRLSITNLSQLTRADLSLPSLSREIIKLIIHSWQRERERRDKGISLRWCAWRRTPTPICTHMSPRQHNKPHPTQLPMHKLSPTHPCTRSWDTVPMTRIKSYE